MAQRVDSYFNVTAIKGEIDQIASYMAQQLGNGAKMGTFTSKGGGGGNTKEFDAMKQALAELQAANQKLQVAEVEEYKQVVQTRQKRNELLSTYKQKSGYINQLERDVKQLTAAYKALDNIESNEAKQALNNLKQKRDELANLKGDYGDHTMRVGEYSRATNGLRLSMGMLAGEMPNAALGMRTFMMSLSNNIQGFAYAISAVKKENAEMMKQFKEGLIDKKPDGVFKQMGKALLSFNVVVMVATTLIMLFQEEIADLTEKLFKGADAAKFFSETLSKMNTEVFGRMADTVKDITKFSMEYYSAVKLGDKDRIKKLEEIGQKEYGLHKDRLKQIGENLNNWRYVFDEYLKIAQITYQNEFRLKAGAEAEFNAKRAAARRKQAEEDLRSFLGTKVKDTPGGMSKQENIDMMISNLQSGKRTGFRGVAGELADQWHEANKEVIKYNDELSELEKITVKIVKYIGKDKPTGTPSRMRDGKSMFEEEKFYDEERIKLVKKIAGLEKQVTDEVTEGFKNSIADRRKATKEMYESQDKLARIDQTLELKKIAEKTTNRQRQLDDDQANNEKLYSQRLMTEERILELRKQYEEASATLLTNANVDALNAQDKYYEAKHAAALRSAQIMMQIQKDEYEQNAVIIDRAQGGIQESVSQRGAEEQAGLNKLSTGQLLSKAFGGKYANNDYAKKLQSRKTSAESIQASINAEKFKLGGAEGTPEQRLESQRKIAELERQNQKEAADYQLELTASIEQEKQDIQVEMAQKTAELLNSIMDAYFERQRERIEEMHEKETKRNDERVAQYEDEAKVGLHTAEELDDFKKRSADYQKSIDEEAARRKEELEKKQFLLSQAIAFGNVLMNTAMGVMSATAIPFGAGLPLIPWIKGMGILNAGIIAAQTIPAFAEGGDMVESGKALLGDGGKHELAWNKRTGKAFITADVPTVYNLEAGTHIFPDVNKLDLNSMLAMRQIIPSYSDTDPQMIGVLKSIDNRLKTQKTANLNGISLMRQMQQSDKFAQRKRGLMN